MASFSRKLSPDVQRNGFVKDSFGYKMSKKVAELTQVVHMLFSRNHEREVELDAMKATYDEEIHRIIKEAKENRERLEFLLRDATRQRQREVEQAADSTASLLKETQERMENMKQDLASEKSQNSEFRELLAQAQKDLDRLRQGSSGVSETLEQTNQRLSEKEMEILKLKSMNRKMQDQYKANERELDDIRRRYRDSDDKLVESERVVDRLNNSLDESIRRTDELSKKLLQAEEELKFARRELKRKSQGNSNNSTKKQMNSFQSSRQNDRKNDEIEALRKEVERLRMELSNREGNFNRVFAKFQPVLVSPDTSSQRVSNHRMMMVTPSNSDPETNRRHFSSGSTFSTATRSGAESPYYVRGPPSSAASPYIGLAATSNHSSKHVNSISHSVDAPRLTNGTRNSSPQFRLVFTK